MSEYWDWNDVRWLLVVALVGYMIWLGRMVCKKNRVMVSDSGAMSWEYLGQYVDYHVEYATQSHCVLRYRQQVILVKLPLGTSHELMRNNIVTRTDKGLFFKEETKTGYSENWIML